MTILDSRPDQFDSLAEIEQLVDAQTDLEHRRSSALVGLAVGSGLVSLAVAVIGVWSLISASVA